LKVYVFSLQIFNFRNHNTKRQDHWPRNLKVQRTKTSIAIYNLEFWTSP